MNEKKQNQKIEELYRKNMNVLSQEQYELIETPQYERYTIMDEGLEKIRKLTLEIGKINDQIISINSSEYPTKAHELARLQYRNEELQERKKEALDKKTEHEYKLKRTKKWF